MFLLGILCSVLSLLQGGDATLVFAGDAMQHDRQIEAARRSDGSFDYSAYFRHVADYVSAADYAVVNLECTLGGKPYKGYPCFSAPEEYAVALKDAGFDLFLHANNHCLDRRDAGLRRTLDQLDMLGVPHIGTYRNAAERAKNYPFVADVKGMKIAFHEQMSVEAVGFKRYLDYLSAIVTISPLLGLLGTVTGGAGEARVATATGLCVAILAFCVYTYFSHQLDTIVTDTEKVCMTVMQARKNA